MSTAVTGIRLNDTLGCLYLASVITMGLWGAGSVQTYYYFDKYEDSNWLRAVVTVAWALCTAHTGLILYGAYTYLVTHYGSSEYLGTVNISLRDTVILTAVVCCIVQSIFVIRIYRMSKKNLFLSGSVSVLVAAQFVATIVYYVKLYPLTTFDEIHTIYTIIRVINAVTAATDTIIAIVLVYLLYTTRSGLKSSDTMMNRIVAFTVNTGLATSVCAIAGLITALTLPSTLVHVLFFMLISHLYLNSMLAALNLRSKARPLLQTSSTGGPVSISMNDIRANNQQVNRTHPRVVNIKVDTETILDNSPQDLSELRKVPSELDGESYLTTKGRAY